MLIQSPSGLAPNELRADGERRACRWKREAESALTEEGSGGRADGRGKRRAEGESEGEVIGDGVEFHGEGRAGMGSGRTILVMERAVAVPASDLDHAGLAGRNIAGETEELLMELAVLEVAIVNV